MVTIDASPSSLPTFSCALTFPANLLGCTQWEAPIPNAEILQSCENETSDLIGSEAPELNSKRGLGKTINQPPGHFLKLPFFWKMRDLGSPGSPDSIKVCWAFRSHMQESYVVFCCQDSFQAQRLQERVVSQVIFGAFN